MTKILLAILSIALFPIVLFAQSWQMTGSLNEPRRMFTTDVLNDGRVLVTGGYDSTITAKASCEIYDPSSGTWSLTAPMHVARAVHRSCKLADGRIVVIGGEVGTGGDDVIPIQTDAIEIFDPATETWALVGHMVIPRENHTATLLPDSTIFIAGGVGANAAILSSCEIFDTKSDSSYMVAPMYEVRHEHQAILLQSGKLLVTGGRDGGYSSVFYHDCEEYDPHAGTWTSISSMPEARMRAILDQFSDGSVLSAAGRNSPNTTTPGSELLDTSSDTWTITDPLKVRCTWTGDVVFPTDRCITTGGIIDAVGPVNNAANTTATCEWYDRPNRLWYFAPQMNIARSEHGAVYLHVPNDSGFSDLILVTGGMVGMNDGTLATTITSTSEILDVSESAIGTYIAHQQNGVAPKELPISEKVNLAFDENGTSHAQIVLQSDLPSEVRLQIYTVLGTSLGQMSLEVNRTPRRIAIAPFVSQSGVYFVRIDNGTSESVGKILFQR